MVVLEYCLLLANLVYLTIELAHESDWDVGHEEKDINCSPSTLSVKICWIRERMRC